MFPAEMEYDTNEHIICLADGKVNHVHRVHFIQIFSIVTLSNLIKPA